MVSHLSKQRMHDYYERFQHELSESGFAVDEPSFIQRMRKIKNKASISRKVRLTRMFQGLLYPFVFRVKKFLWL